MSRTKASRQTTQGTITTSPNQKDILKNTSWDLIIKALTLLVAMANLGIGLYISNLTLENQKSLEEYKKKIASAQLSIHYDNGDLCIEDIGGIEAKNLYIQVSSLNTDFDYNFVVDGIPPITPSLDQINAKGRFLIFNIDSLPLGVKFHIKLTKKGMSGEYPAKADMLITAACSNCILSLEK